MFTNRYALILAALSILLVTLALSQPFSKTPKTMDLSQSSQPVVAPATGPEADQPYVMDSATRSYIARGEALQAAGKLGDAGACPNTARENIFAGVPDNVDSATRSYIARGLAYRAGNDMRACQ